MCILSTFPAYGKVRVNQALKGGDERGGGGCKREKKGTQATRAASFAFRPFFQLSQLSLQRPIRIRCTLFCMTDFTWECIAKGRFVTAEHEKIFATECRRRDSHKKPNVNVKKNSSFRSCGVNFPSGGGPASFETLFSPSGRVESAGLNLAHCCGCIGLRLTRNENLSERVSCLVLAKLETQLNCTVSSRKL